MDTTQTKSPNVNHDLKGSGNTSESKAANEDVDAILCRASVWTEPQQVRRPASPVRVYRAARLSLPYLA